MKYPFGRKARIIFLFAMMFVCTGSGVNGQNMRTAREIMVSRDLMGRDIRDPSVLRVMGEVPRHLFVDPDLRERAYNDHPLPIGEGQTISQPYIVALMTQSLNLKGQGQTVRKILEIGTGSGYQAAVLSHLVPEVYTIEIKKSLAAKATSKLEELGYKNIHVKTGDGYYGWEDKAPFDAIMITCAVDHIPPPLKAQLADGGRLILPLGSPWYYQNLTLVTRKGDQFKVSYITGVSFVPMTGDAQRLQGR